MTTLSSKLFTTADIQTNQKLEDCANGVPNEVSSHFNVGGPKSTGEHIKRIQDGLNLIRVHNPGLAIRPFSVTGIYDQNFASAIADYKKARGIFNYAHQIDPIVGKGTIRAIDREVASIEAAPAPNPAPRPQPAPPPEPADNSGTSRKSKAGSWNRSTTESFQAGQVVKFKIKNLSITGASIKIKSGFGQVESRIILPLSEDELEFSIFQQVPIFWRFEIETDSDAFLVTYEVWTDWLPGDLN